MGLIICGRLLNPMLTSAKGNRLSFSTQKVGIGGRGVAYIYIHMLPPPMYLHFVCCRCFASCSCHAVRHL